MPEVVQDVADHSSQLKANIDRLAQSVQSYRSALQKLADFRRRMKDQVAQVEHEIDKKAEELIQAIQRDKRQLLDDLASAEQTKMQEIDRLQNSVEVQLALVEGLNKHDEKLPSAENGDCEVMNGRMKRMDDLIEYPVSGLRKALVEVTSTGIEFIPAPSENENDDNNILGQVHVSTFEGQ